MVGESKRKIKALQKRRAEGKYPERILNDVHYMSNYHFKIAKDAIIVIPNNIRQLTDLLLFLPENDYQYYHYLDMDSIAFKDHTQYYLMELSYHKYPSNSRIAYDFNKVYNDIFGTSL